MAASRNHACSQYSPQWIPDGCRSVTARTLSNVLWFGAIIDSVELFKQGIVRYRPADRILLGVKAENVDTP